MRVRTRRRTGWPTALHIRRTCRLRPRGSPDGRTPDARTPTSAGRSQPVIELDALAQRAQRARAAGVPPSTSATYSLATPCDGWVSSWSQRPVVGQDEEPLGVTVQAADREDSRVGRHQRHDRGPPLGVIRRGDDPVGLVQQVVDEIGRDRHEDAVDLDPRRPMDRPAVRARRPRRRHGDAARSDQLFAGSSPGSDADAGQHLLQAFALEASSERSPRTPRPSADCRSRSRSPATSGPGRKSSTAGSWPSESSPRRLQEEIRRAEERRLARPRRRGRPPRYTPAASNRRVTPSTLSATAQGRGSDRGRRGWR